MSGFDKVYLRHCVKWSVEILLTNDLKKRKHHLGKESLLNITESRSTDIFCCCGSPKPAFFFGLIDPEADHELE